MSAFDVAFSEAVGLEGKYSSDEKDPGNWTSGRVNVGECRGTAFGISAAAYPTMDIVALASNPGKAKAIYLTDYWAKLRCSALPDPIAIALFKEGINLGVEGASKALQRSLKTTADGSIGQLTIGLATSQPVAEVLERFLTECAYAYVGMANFKEDGHGWLYRVIRTAIQAQLSPEEVTGSGRLK